MDGLLNVVVKGLFGVKGVTAPLVDGVMDRRRCGAGIVLSFWGEILSELEDMVKDPESAVAGSTTAASSRGGVVNAMGVLVPDREAVERSSSSISLERSSSSSCIDLK